MSKTENQIESPQESLEPVQQSQAYSKSDYIKARAIISAYKEAQKNKPKRQCSEKQLAALAAGREKAKANRAAKKQASTQ